MTMLPLQHSFDNTSQNTLESELKDLFIKLYADNLEAQADEINVFAVPFLGSFSQIEREVARDGLALLRNDDESGMRYLFEAWRYRNPERGFHFLRTYCRVLWGDGFDVQQMHQRKTNDYPKHLRSNEELIAEGDLETDYFLTSRVRVDLEDSVTVPDVLIKSLQTTIAARFVLKLRIFKTGKNELGFFDIGQGSNTANARGESVICPRDETGKTTFGFSGVSTTSLFSNFSGNSIVKAKTADSNTDYLLASISGASTVFNGCGDSVMPSFA